MAGEKSSLQNPLGDVQFLPCNQLGRWLVRRCFSKALDQESHGIVRLGMAGEPQQPLIRRGDLRIEHLDSSQFFERLAGCQTRGQRTQPRLQCPLQATGLKADENVRLNQCVKLMVDGAVPQTILEDEGIQKWLRWGAHGVCNLHEVEDESARDAAGSAFGG